MLASESGGLRSVAKLINVDCKRHYYYSFLLFPVETDTSPDRMLEAMLSPVLNVGAH